MTESQVPSESLHATRALRAGKPAQEAGPRRERETTDLSRLPAICVADLTRDDLTGLSLEPYELGAKIGGGGMGKVFRARHVHLDRVFAIKFVAANMAGVADVQLRFEQETRALGQLQHPQIVNAVDAGCFDGLKYLVTEFIDGQDFAQLVKARGSIPAAEACELIRQAALGLAYSHAAGFIHRDIKPSNLIVNRQGVVKILDFGLVHGGEVDHQLTAAGETLGTWDFLAPEQAHDASQVDHRGDLYSLGCTLLYLLSGQAPFSDARYSTPATKLKGHLFETPGWLDHPPAEISAELIAVLRRMLAKSPDERYQHAEDIATALAPFTVQQRLSEAFSAVAKSRMSQQQRWISLTLALCLLGTLCWIAATRPQGDTQATRPVKTIPSAAPAMPNETNQNSPVEPPESVDELSAAASRPEPTSLTVTSNPTPNPKRNGVTTVDLLQTKSAAPIRFPMADGPLRNPARQEIQK